MRLLSHEYCISPLMGQEQLQIILLPPHEVSPQKSA